MSRGRAPDWSDRVLPWMIACAVVVAAIVGMRAIGRAQSGEIGRDAAADANATATLAVPEFAPQRRRLHACRDARGRAVQAGAACAPTASATDVETVPVELAPPR
jgi:hypothetical protein